ncbi:MAG: hypothetical protein HYZ74_08215 [Elusimicrobia bacterium]|nr:hypothetical protein [Elusimicrobiota bacterium]
MRTTSKTLSTLLCSAVILAAPGPLAMTAAAQIIKTAPIGLRFNSPVSAPSLNAPTTRHGSLTSATPSLVTVSPSLAPTPFSATARPASLVGVAVSADRLGSPLALLQSRDAAVSLAQKETSLNVLYENVGRSRPAALAVLALSAASADDSAPAPLTRSGALVMAVVTLRDPGSPEALETLTKRWKMEYGFQRDYDRRPTPVKDGLIMIWGSIPSSQQSLLAANGGALDVFPALGVSAENIVTTPYQRPVEKESLFRRGLRTIHEKSDGAAILVGFIPSIALVGAIIGPLLAFDKAVPSFLGWAVLGGGLALLASVTSLQALFQRVPAQIRAAVPNAFLAFGGAVLIGVSQPLLGSLAVINAALGWKTMSAFLVQKSANTHSIDRFVNSMEATMLINALGWQLLAMTWHALRPGTALAVVALSTLMLLTMLARTASASESPPAKQEK